MSELNNIKSWLHLQRAPGLGWVKIQPLLEACGDAEAVCQLHNLPSDAVLPAAAKSYLRQANDQDLEAELTWLSKPNNHILTVDDPLYPPQLRLINDPPLLLYVKGNPAVLLLPQLAVVGSRNASQAGLNNTQDFCHDLARQGLVITSGLAIGVDTQAHQAAVAAGGQTVAVMGTGINSIYPKQNKALAQTITNHGAVVSELPLDTPPHAHHFPRRNRIIAGLSMGTLVVEAAQKSGTLITARLSMEYNRPVMAIPGSIHNPLAKGCHALIKQGAKLVETAPDILQEIEPGIHMLSDQLSSKLHESSLEKSTGTPDIKLSESQQHILRHLDYHPTAFDDIVEGTQLTSGDVASDLLIMELAGVIEKLPGANYQKI
ncbi:DNA-processing protein DprA [Marinicella meishanensis]|uniref:DNA-processing protein DprA n=1 Tax=Marinicella meishanensis TaxID=2873263 RepID=UPI001CBF700C|nr:DNA-processing protein DprA [Marinicella sp. NBU2979]